MDVSQTRPLEFIIRGTPHVLMNILRDIHHPTRSTPLAHSQCESIPQPNGINESVGVRPQSEERFDGQMLEHGITL